MKQLTQTVLIVVGIVLLFGIGGYALVTRDNPTPENPQPVTNFFNPLDLAYTIGGEPVILVNGKSNSTSVAVWGKPVQGDLNGDGASDAALLLTQNSSGSGIFYYVVSALQEQKNGTRGTNAILLGDRIAPQNIAIQNGQILVNYADRKPGEPMTTKPSVGMSVYLKLNGTTLEKIKTPSTTPTSTAITYLTSEKDSRLYCNGADMDSAGYQKTITKEHTTTTPQANPTKLQIIKKTIDAATTGTCRTALNQLNITEKNGVVTIPPIDGWAGVSIALCSCKPLVEVNLLRIPGVTQVLWSANGE